MKEYLLQIRYDDGSVGATMAAPSAIINKYGFRDCSNEEYEVYDVSEFGKIVKLMHFTVPGHPNWHRFVVPGEIIPAFEGFSPEH